MKKTLYKSIASVAIAGILSLASVTANASVISGILIPGENTLEDTDGDILRDANGNLIESGAGGNFTTGMYLEALLRFDGINGASTPVAAGDLDYELIAYSQIEIIGLNDLGNGTSEVIYGATGNLGANVVVEVYENTNANTVDFSDDPATAISNVLGSGDFSLVAEFGFGDVDDFWSGLLPTSLSDFFAIGDDTGTPDQASGVFGLSLLNNPGGLNIVTNGIMSGASGQYHDLVGNASASERSSTFDEGWAVETDTQVKFMVVPEPGILLLMGAGLFGVGIARRRQIKH